MMSVHVFLVTVIPIHHRAFVQFVGYKIPYTVLYVNFKQYFLFDVAHAKFF